MAWAGSGGRNALVDLQTKAFVDVDPPPKGQLKLGELPRAGTNFVVVSDSTPDVPNDQLAIHSRAKLPPLLARRVNQRR